MNYKDENHVYIFSPPFLKDDTNYINVFNAFKDFIIKKQYIFPMKSDKFFNRNILQNVHKVVCSMNIPYIVFVESKTFVVPSMIGKWKDKGFFVSPAGIDKCDNLLHTHPELYSFNLSSSSKVEEDKIEISEYINEAFIKRSKSIEVNGVKGLRINVNITCSYCGDMGEHLRRCAKCKSTKYCSKQCQIDDWKTHKKECMQKNHP
jgi:hypothetical protein